MLKYIAFTITLLGQMHGEGSERQERIIGKYLSARYQIIFDPGKFQQSQAQDIKQAVSEIDSLDMGERIELYTLFYAYFDKDGEWAQRIFQTVSRNKDEVAWKNYLINQKYHVKREMGEARFQDLLKTLSGPK